MFEFTEDEYNIICKKALLNDELSKILLYKIKGYSTVQISLAMNMSESTVNRRLKLLKKKIIKCL